MKSWTLNCGQCLEGRCHDICITPLNQVRGIIKTWHCQYQYNKQSITWPHGNKDFNPNLIQLIVC